MSGTRGVGWDRSFEDQRDYLLESRRRIKANGRCVHEEIMNFPQFVRDKAGNH